MNPGGVDGERLQRLLDRPDLEWLVDRLVRRVERGQPLDGTVTLQDPSPSQRAAADRLLGRRPTRGAVLSVPVEAVSRVVVGAGVAPDLESGLRALRGPLRDLASQRARSEAAWARAEEPLDALAHERPRLAGWRERIRARGLLRRLAGEPADAHALASAVRVCVLALPVADEPRSVFAARVLDDAHALDDDRPLAGLVHGAMHALSDLPPGQGVEWRRAVWESAGLLSGELSAPVLTLGLAAAGDALTSRLLAACAQQGEPVHLSLRQLTRHPPDVSGLAGADVFVCENPSVVAVAAERLGPRCAPLVCGGGHPGGAARRLLRLLVDSGARLRYHGDFDWAGLTIAAGVMDRYAATPWRLDAASYLTAVRGGSGGALHGRAAGSPWEPALARAMREHGVRVEEEQVLDDLIDDLRRR